MMIDYKKIKEYIIFVLSIIVLVQILFLLVGWDFNIVLDYVFWLICAFSIGIAYSNKYLNNSIDVSNKLSKMQENINNIYNENGVNDDVLEKQVNLNICRHELDIPDDDEIIINEGYVQ